MARSNISIKAVRDGLPARLDALQAAARGEGFRFVDRLAAEWAAGSTRFDRPGELLLAAFLDQDLCGVGGLTQEPSLPGALRMRRFYVLPALRRRGVARHLVAALLAHATDDVLVTVNAGTAQALLFWERSGFIPVTNTSLTYTHVLRRPRAESGVLDAFDNVQRAK